MPGCGPPSYAPRSEVGRVFQARGTWRVSSLCQPRGAPVPRPGVWTLPSRDREEGAPRARLSPTDKAPSAPWGLSSPESVLVFAAHAQRWAWPDPAVIAPSPPAQPGAALTFLPICKVGKLRPRETRSPVPEPCSIGAVKGKREGPLSVPGPPPKRPIPRAPAATPTGHPQTRSWRTDLLTTQVRSPDTDCAPRG